jgi:hypothetical protein
MPEEVTAATNAVREALKKHPSFRGIEHAVFEEPDEEPVRQANVLKFSYRTRALYAHVEGEFIRVTRPGSAGKQRPVGTPVPVDTPELAAAVAKMLDEFLTPQ